MTASRHVSLVVTHACDLACAYCFMGEHHASHMPDAVAARALEFALAVEPGGRAHVAFFGGEPTLRLAEVLAWAARAGELARERGARLTMQMTTNGARLDDARVAALHAAGVEITLSLDGTRAAHEAGRPRRGGGSSFDAVVEGARALARSGRAFDVVSVVTPDNVAWLDESVAFAADLGARRVHLNPHWAAPWADEHLEVWGRELAKLADRWAAGFREGARLGLPLFEGAVGLVLARDDTAGAAHACRIERTRVAVAPSGVLYPCERLVGDDRDRRFALGHVDELADAGAFVARGALAIARGPAADACGSCAERDRCSGHCVCANVEETGEPHVPGGVQCWLARTAARLADDAAWAMLEARVPAFVEWAYGRVPRVEPTAAARRRETARTAPASHREDASMTAPRSKPSPRPLVPVARSTARLPSSAHVAIALALGAAASKPALAGEPNRGADEPDAGGAPASDRAALVLYVREGITFGAPPTRGDVELDGGAADDADDADDANDAGARKPGCEPPDHDHEAPPGVFYVYLDGELVDDAKRGTRLGVTPGEHELRVVGPCGEPALRVVTVREGETLNIDVGSMADDRCAHDEPLGGVPPPPPERAGGCCGGARPATAAGNPSALVAIAGVALALGRRRARAPRKLGRPR